MFYNLINQNTEISNKIKIQILTLIHTKLFPQLHSKFLVSKRSTQGPSIKILKSDVLPNTPSLQFFSFFLSFFLSFSFLISFFLFSSAFIRAFIYPCRNFIDSSRKFFPYVQTKVVRKLEKLL